MILAGLGECKTVYTVGLIHSFIVGLYQVFLQLQHELFFGAHGSRKCQLPRSLGYGWRGQESGEFAMRSFGARFYSSLRE